MKITFTIFISLFTNILFSQSCFEGQLVNAKDLNPVDAVLVFIPYTQYSTITDANGFFTFEKCPETSFEIVLSHISFQNKTIQIPNGLQKLPMPIRVFESNYELEEVVVKAARSRIEKRIEKQLIRALLGSTSNANHCYLENPQALRYTKNGDTYNVKATEILKFRNEALGYVLHFNLNSCYVKGSQISYNGKPFFENLDPADYANTKWKKSRIKSYEGSVYHFYKSLRAGTLKEDGFIIYKGRLTDSYQFVAAQRVLGPEIITEIRENGDLILDFEAIKVAYIRERQAGTSIATSNNSLAALTGVEKSNANSGDKYSLENIEKYQCSYLDNEGAEIIIRADHFPSTNSKVVEYGYWNDERLADLLPYKDYFEFDTKRKTIPTSIQAPTKNGYKKN